MARLKSVRILFFAALSVAAFLVVISASLAGDTNYNSYLINYNLDGSGYTVVSNQGPQIGENYTNFIGAPSWSPDDKQIVDGIYSGGPNFDPDVIYAFNADGGGARKIVSDENGSDQPDWSSSNKIIFRSGPSSGKGTALNTINPDGSGRQTIRSTSFYDFSPRWSPDATRAAFSSSRADRVPGTVHKPMSINTVQGSGDGLTSLSPVAAKDDSPTWSPDGTKIAYVTISGVGMTAVSNLAVMSADGSGRSIILTAAKGLYYNQPDWSPDGQSIAFAVTSNSDATDPQAASSIYVVHPDGSGLTKLIEYGEAPRYSHNGKQLAYLAYVLPGNKPLPIDYGPGGSSNSNGSTLTISKFKPSKRRVTVKAVKKGRQPKFTYRLSAAATVTFTLKRVSPKGSMRKLKTFNKTGKSGGNKLGVNFKSLKLKAKIGSYILSARATASGVNSKTKSARFKVVK